MGIRKTKSELFDAAKSIGKNLDILEKNRNVAQSIFARAEGKFSIQTICEHLDWPENHYREYLKKGRLRIDKLFIAADRIQQLLQ
ncbi:hypothetical protein B1J93_08880 [Leptospira kirschneri serovar Pomona]|uniref:Uncharacterized protein n=2 Tax=Leptospira TaxID=171 RepID=A0A1T1DQD3_9LEPT|nr:MULTISPECIES: hypothetical protein [Leptospira]EKR71846.1 hypothetical protein LEP1GSC041_0603 [Leptospira noguchii str. 2006001870]EMO39510.1 hypothetical protein LEP1GSC186_3285 [Leptospira noguchii serovar Autumnalis str. ZUN142]OOV43078.1 hypothetical protein B1J93_08880 [Leptospira kirschneri serovar Pomona]UOG50901.1 hypothetical protein MAL00_19260 [Leptospira noguchii]